jgi:orotate phosphoribosyltransferase
MSLSETRLLQLLRERSYREGTFQLASGDTSSFYIDGKMTEVFSQGASLIGEVLYERTKDLRFEAIGGLESGAIPLATAAVMAYDRHGRTLEGFWVRDAAKSHGTKKLIEGKLAEGSRVVIVDDVVTKGNSVMKAIEAVKEIGCEIARVVTIVDRLAGTAELLQKAGITDYQSVFTINDLRSKKNVPGPAAVAIG